MGRQPKKKEGKRGHHEGSYTLNASGTVGWRVRVKFPDGTGERRTGTARNMTEARAAVRQVQEEAAAGLRPVSAALTVGQMVTEYMEAKAGTWADRTRWNNEKLYTRYVLEDLGQLRAAGLEAKRLRAYFAALEDRGLGDSGRRQVHSLLSGAYKRAIGDGLLRDNPTAHAKPGRSKDSGPAKLKHFTPEELRRFIEAARADRWALPLAFMGMTGLRVGEALALTWADLKTEEGGAVFVDILKTRSEHEGKAYTGAPKTAKGKRRVYLSPEALEVLEEMRGHIALEKRVHGKVWPTNKEGASTGPLFPSALSGDFMRQDTARHVMRRTCERAGLPLLSPHALRHSTGTFLIARGADPVSVSALLGHAQTSTTLNLYAHALPDKLRALAFGTADLPGGQPVPARDTAKEEAADPRPARRVPKLARSGKASPRRKRQT